MLDRDKNAFLIYRKLGRPEGVEVGALSSGVLNFSGPHAEPSTWTFVISIAGAAGALAREALTDAAKEAAKKWIVAFIKRLKETRSRVNGREAKAQDDLEKLISDAIDIGRND